VRGGACARLPLDLTEFEESTLIDEATHLYRCVKDGLVIVMKAFDVSEFKGWEVEREMQNVSNLCHLLIAAPR
jgi:hypothetical protein